MFFQNNGMFKHASINKKQGAENELKKQLSTLHL